MVNYNNYKELDYDGDGKIEQNELQAAASAGGSAAALAGRYKAAVSTEKNKETNNPNGTSGISIEQNTFGFADDEGVVQAGAYISWNSGEQPVAWNISKAINQIQKRYGIDYVWKQIEKAVPGIVGTGYGGSSYLSAFTELLKNYSIANYYAAKSSPEGSTKNTMTFFEFLNQYKAGTATGAATPTSFISLTGKNSAWDVYKNTFRNLFGMNPTKEQFNDFYTKLNAKEKKYVSTSKVSGSTKTEVNEQFDVQTFATQHALGQADLTGDLKGVAGQYQNWVNQTAKAYGLEGSFAEGKLPNFLKGLISGKFQEDDITDVFRRKSALMYGAFAEDLEKNPDLSLAEIMESYMSMYSNTLEIGYNELNIADVARLASSGTEKVNMYDFEKALRQDGRYQTTKQANMEAQNLAVSFARAFGMNI